MLKIARESARRDMPEPSPRYQDDALTFRQSCLVFALERLPKGENQDKQNDRENSERIGTFTQKRYGITLQ